MSGRAGEAVGELDRTLFRRVASLLANQVGKRLLPRVRPLLDSVPAARRARRTPGSHSFPSGHAASAAAFAVGASLEVPALAVPLGVPAAAVGFSRVYTGVHYPADVLAGVALGAGVALSGHRLLAAARTWPAARRSPHLTGCSSQPAPGWLLAAARIWPALAAARIWPAARRSPHLAAYSPAATSRSRATSWWSTSRQLKPWRNSSCCAAVRQVTGCPSTYPVVVQPAG
jgi:PAP2 superfamily protein